MVFDIVLRFLLVELNRKVFGSNCVFKVLIIWCFVGLDMVLSIL